MIYCHVVEAQCEAPAGYRTGGGGVMNGTKSARHTCFECCEPVCGACSKKRKRVVKGSAAYLVGARYVRVCLDCIANEQARAKRLLHAADRIA